MKKFLYWTYLFTLLLITPSLSFAAGIPTPARIGGSVTVDGTALTDGTDTGYTFVVTKEDGTPTVPAASDTDGLNASDLYIIDIPIYEATDQPGGVNSGDTVIIHVYDGETELLVDSPENGEITVGASASNTTENIVAYSPRTLTMAVSPSESGSTDPATGSHSYTYNEEVDVVATPAIGYVFDHWIVNSVDFIGTPASTSITMNQDKTVTAVFSDCDYTLTMAVNDAQMGSTDPAVGDSAQACNGTVTITATPAEGYYFSGWIGDGIADTTNASTTVSMDADKTVTARFSAITYTLTVETPSNGTISLDPTSSGNVYAEDAVVTATATPASGYIFSSWTGDAAGAESASTDITMDEDKTIGATFAECTTTLTMAVNDSQMGSTSPAVGANTQSCDEQVTITATPESGYRFTGWTGDTVADSTSATTTITMDDDKSVTANFTAIIHNLTIGTDDNGTTDPVAGTYEHAEGSVVTITATPATGWVFSSWTGDVDYPYAATTTVTIDEDKTVTPVFLTDSDGDGKDDTSEQGPDGSDTSYDGDDDGTADSTQHNVVSTYNTDGTYYVTLSTDAAYTLSVTPVIRPASTGPSNVTMDYGYFDINVSGLTAGGSATVTITYPSSASTPDTYYKYGPTPDNTTSHWYEFLYDSTTETGAEFSGNTITLHFVDGLRGDDDLDDTNGIIDDPGGAGRVVVSDDDDDDVASGGGGGGGGIFGEISIRDVLGYHFDGNTSDGTRVYMPVTNAYKALKGAQTHVESFAPNIASFIRCGFDFLEQKAESNKDGFLYWTGTYTFPVLGKIAEYYLDIVGAERLKADAYVDTTISIEEFKILEQQGKAVAPHRVNFEDETDEVPVHK